MVDPRTFGVDSTDLSRRLASWLIDTGHPNHAQLMLEQRQFTKPEMAYLITVAAQHLLEKGARA